MRSHKANITGLTSPGQQSEMKSILAGTWPPLKPLPVFKYETVEYRATIDFDKKRGEWVCRKTSLPSNEVQELRGALREITLALPHGEAEMLIEGAEQPEPELVKDTHRRLQALRDWRQNYQNGARYFELRDFLSESQRTELDDSLRLSLTARQLQFNAKNVASVFDDLSIAGGRFAAIIELAKRKNADQETEPQPRVEEAVPEAESATDDVKESQETSSPELRGFLHDNGAIVPDQGGVERRPDADEFPAVSIKNVFPEQDQASSAEQMAPHTVPHQPFEIATSEIADADPLPLIEYPHLGEQHSGAFGDFAAQVPKGQSFAYRVEGSSWHFPALKISAFQVNVFAMLFLFAVTSFTVGLTVGRGPLGKRLREPPKSIIADEASPPAVADQEDESTPRTLASPVASSADSAGSHRLDDATPKESPRGSGNSVEARSANSDATPATESTPSFEPELNSEHSTGIRPMVGSVLPPASPKLAHPPKAVRPTRNAQRNPAPHKLTSTLGAAPHLPRSSAILVDVPAQGSQPIMVSFPEKAIAATSSQAIASQLSVSVAPEPGLAKAHKSARLEAGELLSFVWPRYIKPGNRHGMAETIRVRATIGQLGQVLDVKFLSGSASLLPATTEAISQWRYRPTLLDERPVQAQLDVTIEFRPPRYSSQLRTQHPSRN